MGNLGLGENTQPLGNRTTTYLPDTIGENLDLRSNTQPLGNGTTSYLPTTVAEIFY